MPYLAWHVSEGKESRLMNSSQEKHFTSSIQSHFSEKISK